MKKWLKWAAVYIIEMYADEIVRLTCTSVQEQVKDTESKIDDITAGIFCDERERTVSYMKKLVKML